MNFEIGTKNLRTFFYSRHLSDAIVITIAIILPSIVLANYGLFQMGTIISLGALCIGISDIPGPVKEKRNGMLLGNAVIFCIALLAGYAGINIYLEGLVIFLACFFFSMLILYGNRTAGIGNSALTVMIMLMYWHPEMDHVLEDAVLLLAGGIWYMLLSLGFYAVLPYRQVQQALSDCMMETTKAVRLKMLLYINNSNHKEIVDQLLLQQIKVNEKQSELRYIMYNDDWVQKQSTQKGSALVMAFVDLVDLYDYVMATGYDNADIKNKFQGTEAFKLIAHTIEKFAENLEGLSHAVLSRKYDMHWHNAEANFVLLKNSIDKLAADGLAGTFGLKRRLVLLYKMDKLLNSMAGYYNGKTKVDLAHLHALPFAMYLPPKTDKLKIFISNLSFRAATFRYAVRVALVACFTFGFTNLFFHGAHPYWILFTVVFITKPAFSLSKQRNWQRLGGTLIGGALVFPALLFVHNTTIIFMLLMLCMVIAYSFMRINYIIFVVFMTCYLLLLFKLLGTTDASLLQERVLDTLIGVCIAFIASYLVFPNWEFKQINLYMAEMLKANFNYLSILSQYVAGAPVDIQQYKLTRKEVYVHLANLAASAERMTYEPTRYQINQSSLQQFIRLNYELTSLIAENAPNNLTQKPEGSTGNFHIMNQALNYLNSALTLLERPAEALVEVDAKEPAHSAYQGQELLAQHFLHIRTICYQLKELAASQSTLIN